MSYNHRIINDRPVLYFPLNEGTTAFVDSMRAVPAQVNGTPVASPPLVVGGGTSYAFTGSDNFRFATTVFQEDSVNRPFTLEAWFKPISVNGRKGILGHAALGDGLTFDGERITFATFHGTAGRAEASYYPPSLSGSFHVVGVHTGSKNELYVNGVRVASVDLTDDQLNSRYEITLAAGYLYSGHMPGSIIIDSVAVYGKALNSRQVKLHFLWGREVLDAREVVENRLGTYWEFTDDTARVFYDFSFDTQEEWLTGETGALTIRDNQLLPVFNNDVTVEGNWTAGVILSAVGEIIDGSKINWDADGPVKVFTSISDGEVWDEAVNGREVPRISSRFVPGVRSLMVRVVLPAGEQPDTITRMRSLSIKFYEDRTSRASVAGQNAEFAGTIALASERHQPIEQDDTMGVYLYNSAAQVKANNAITLEFWVNPDILPASESYIFDARPTVNAYLRYTGTQWSTTAGTIIFVNGQRVNGAAISIQPKRWTHVVAVIPDASNATISLGTPSSFPLHIGFYANYDYSMTDTAVRNLYNAYLGIVSARITERSGLKVADSARNVRIYAKNWTLTGSG